MNFTEKIAEQCNGASQCELSSQPTYIHKCGKTSDYLYVAFKCIREQDTFDICRAHSRSYTLRQIEQGSVFIKSSDFPTEYSSSLDCSCLVSSSSSASYAASLKLETLWFSLQDNDYLNLFGKNITGWMNPTHEMPMSQQESTNNSPQLIRFQTDEALAYKGFWLRIGQKRACHDGWQLVGDSCIRVYSESLDWRSASQRCQQMNGHLVRVDDVVGDLKLTQYVKQRYPEIDSYWIGLRKYVDQHNQEKWMWSSTAGSSNTSNYYADVSWWPWRKTTNQTGETKSNHCVVKKRNEDGYFAIPCDTRVKHSFICQTGSISAHTQPLETVIRIKCGSSDEIVTEYDSMIKSARSKPSSFQTIGSFKPRQETEDQVKILLPSSSISPLRPVSKERMRSNVAKIGTPSSTPSTAPISSSSVSSTTQSMVAAPINSVLFASSKHARESRVNTTILAGIICGIGLVIVIINLGVLFMCRRNLKKFMRSSSKDTRPGSSHDDIIQDYFEAFTLHNGHQPGSTIKKQAYPSSLLNSATLMMINNSNNTGSGQMPGLHSNILTIPRDQLQLINSECLESAQLFFNRDTVRQSTSAFRPFNREQPQHQNLLLTLSNKQHQLNQYDKITHSSTNKTSNSKLRETEENGNGVGQYAHTYESLDTLEMPCSRQRGTLVHLGITGRNYRTVNINGNELLLLANAGVTTNSHQISPPSLGVDASCQDQSQNTTNFNLSTSSSSSSSGTSSTHQLLKDSAAMANNEALLQQLVIMNNNNLNNSAAHPMTAAMLQASWSPDSAYYTTSHNNQTFNGGQNFVNCSNNNMSSNNFSSHLV